MKTYLKSLAIAGLTLFSAHAFSQTTLRIGDQAPPLKYSKWIQGTPVDQFEKDRLYVVEFWATWCGPCKAAMPHLSDLSEKYKDNATFIGYNIWEKTGSKPYESAIPAVTSFVKNMSKELRYNVAMDNNEQYMGNKWMKAAGLYGIPATFLVKNDKIIWIGHPIKLDSIMPLAISGKYDQNVYKKGFEKQSDRMAKLAEMVNAVTKTVDSSIAAKDFQKGISVTEAAEKSNPTFAILFKRMKAKVLLSYDEQKGVDYIRNWSKEMDGVSSTLAFDIVGRDDLTVTSYGYAIEILKDAVEKNGGMPLIAHTLASAYAKAGDLPNAIVTEQKAIDQAKLAISQGKYKEMILDSTVPEYEAALKGYQEKAKMSNKQ